MISTCGSLRTDTKVATLRKVKTWNGTMYVRVRVECRAVLDFT